MNREEAYNRIDAIIAKHEIDDEYVTITSALDYDALRFARKLLEQEHCEDEYIKTEVLDKIRAEINGMYRVILKDTPKDDWAVGWNDCLDEVLQIIDKYLTEGSDKE